MERADLLEAVGEGFDQTTAERVLRLLGVLRGLQSAQITRDRFTLKGGTALNVFHDSRIARLSVDIDLMATGFPDAAPGTDARERAAAALTSALDRLDYRVRDTSSDAGWSFRADYTNSQGTSDRLKIDLDFLNRMTLLPPVPLPGPRLFHGEDLRFPIVDPAELMGQKLTAVAYRAVERDLFDMSSLLELDWDRRYPRARGMYLAYSLMQDLDWARLAYPVKLDVRYDHARLRDLLRAGAEAPSLNQIRDLARSHLELAAPPYTSATPAEQRLRGRVLDGDRDAFGSIAGDDDRAYGRRVANHPGLLWRLQQKDRRMARSRADT